MSSLSPLSSTPPSSSSSDLLSSEMNNLSLSKPETFQPATASTSTEKTATVVSQALLRRERPFGEIKQMPLIRKGDVDDVIRKAQGLITEVGSPEAIKIALKILEQGFLLNPTDKNVTAKLYYLQALGLYRQGNHDESLKAAETGIELEPSDRFLGAYLLLIAVDLSQKLSRQESLSPLERKKKLENARKYILLGLSDLQKDPSKNTTLQARFYRAHAILLQQEGEIEAALAQVEKALSLNPLDSRVRDNLQELASILVFASNKS